MKTDSKFHTLSELTGWLGVNRQGVIDLLASKSTPRGECVIWSGPTVSRGYGQHKQNNRRCTAHRMAYIANNGPLAPGLVVMHICDTPACINPDHLVAGSNNANMLDMKIKGRAAHGSRHPRSKLSTEQVTEIRVLAKYGYPHEDLAQYFQVSRPTITKVANGSAYSREGENVSSNE